VVVVSSTTSSFFAFLTGAFFFLGVVGSGSETSTVGTASSVTVVVVVSSTTSSFFAFLTGAFFFLGVVGSTTSYVVFSTCSGTHSSTTTEVVFLVGAILSNTLLILSRDGFLTFLLLVERGIII
jgi:hypothetical protein